jgi:hypothetical protein
MEEIRPEIDLLPACNPGKMSFLPVPFNRRAGSPSYHEMAGKKLRWGGFVGLIWAAWLFSVALILMFVNLLPEAQRTFHPGFIVPVVVAAILVLLAAMALHVPEAVQVYL